MAWVSTRDTVQDYLSQLSGYADGAYSTTLGAISSIAGGFAGALDEIGIDWSPSVYDLAGYPGYVKPGSEPKAPTISFVSPDSISNPISVSDIKDILDEAKGRFSAAEMPQFSAVPMELSLPVRPNAVLPTAPGDPAALVVPSYPSAPTLDEPSLPDLLAVELPTLIEPDLSGIDALIAALREEKPDSPVAPTLTDFATEAARYYALTDSQLTAFIGRCPALASLSPRLAELLSGQSIGVPAAVALGLRDRAFAAEDRQAVQAEQEALTDWLARGFTLPGGALEAKLALVRQLNRDKKAQLNRDLWLEEAKLEIETLRFAIQQGISYEGILRESWGKLYDIARVMAISGIETALKSLEASISLYRVQIDAWKTEFDTIKDQLQIELAKLEVFKSELEGQKLVFQINQQSVDLYTAQWNALNSKIGLYKSRVDAANSMLQGELAKLEWAAKRVQIYTSKVGAYESEWRAYGEGVRAESAKIELYKGQVEAFSTRVGAYKTQVDAIKTVADLDVTDIKTQLEAWQARAEHYKTKLSTELGRIDTLVKSAGVDVEVFKAKGEIENNYAGFQAKKLDYSANTDRLNFEEAAKAADLAMTRQIELSKLGLSALDATARAGSQLAGSAMSALNVHAGLSASSSEQWSESHNYNYEMS